MTRFLGRKEILNTKNNEFNSAIIFSLWHESSRLCRCQANVPGIRLSEKIVLLMHPHDVDVPYSLVVTFYNLSLDAELCLRGDKNGAFL